MNEQETNEMLQSDYTKDPPQKNEIDASLYYERIRESEERFDSIRQRLRGIYLNLHHISKTAERIYIIADDCTEEDGSAIYALSEMIEESSDGLKTMVLLLINEANYHPVKLDPFAGDGDELDL